MNHQMIYHSAHRGIFHFSFPGKQRGEVIQLAGPGAGRGSITGTGKTCQRSNKFKLYKC